MESLRLVAVTVTSVEGDFSFQKLLLGRYAPSLAPTVCLVKAFLPVSSDPEHRFPSDRK